MDCLINLAPKYLISFVFLSSIHFFLKIANRINYRTRHIVLRTYIDVKVFYTKKEVAKNYLFSTAVKFPTQHFAPVDMNYRNIIFLLYSTSCTKSLLSKSFILLLWTICDEHFNIVLRGLNSYYFICFSGELHLFLYPKCY